MPTFSTTKANHSGSLAFHKICYRIYMSNHVHFNRRIRMWFHVWYGCLFFCTCFLH